jgi:glycosyltransferase involved in cell wall biosynthesis
VRVLVFSQDVVGSSMAGPGIRYWELARALAKQHDVTLAVPNAADVAAEGVRVVRYGEGRTSPLLRGHDVVVAQLLTPGMVRVARAEGVHVVADCYDPMVLEGLENHRDRPSRSQRRKGHRVAARTELVLRAADALICASERQRDLWVGALMALGRLSADDLGRERAADRLIRVVPFGLPAGDPVRQGVPLRERYGIPAEATVLLWGGGIWNWFDPLTVIRAVERMPDVHLVFMGVQHPNDKIVELEMAGRALALADELGLRGTRVHVNEGWVPYADRQDFLLGADLGVSAHFRHLETRYSFRTRFLDCLWAGLPLVGTEGDALIDLIAAHGAGVTVPEGDVDALVAAVRAYGHGTPAREEAAAAARALRERFRWDVVVEPLLDVIQGLGPARPRAPRPGERQAAADLYAATAVEALAERGIGWTARAVVRRLTDR